MKLEMKSIKHSAFASEETDCYEGYVYVDGKKAIYVSNDGKGGADRLLKCGVTIKYIFG